MATLDRREAWNLMLASELVDVAHFPMRSYYGYQVTPASYPRTAILRRAGPDDIALGDVLEGNLRTGEALPYPVESFFSHALISGSPGSGKTTAARTSSRSCRGNTIYHFLSSNRPSNESSGLWLARYGRNRCNSLVLGSQIVLFELTCWSLKACPSQHILDTCAPSCSPHSLGCLPSNISSRGRCYAYMRIEASIRNRPEF